MLALDVSLCVAKVAAKGCCPGYLPEGKGG